MYCRYAVGVCNKLNYMQQIIESNIEAIQKLCVEHHIKKLYAFGSVVTEDFRPDSDVDFLYEMDYAGFDFDDLDKNPYDPFLVFFDLKEKLEKLLSKKVDLIPNQEFRNRYFNEAVAKTKIPLYISA